MYLHQKEKLSNKNNDTDESLKIKKKGNQKT